MATEISPSRWPEDLSRAVPAGESRHGDKLRRQGGRGDTGGDTGRRRKSLWCDMAAAEYQQILVCYHQINDG